MSPQLTAPIVALDVQYAGATARAAAIAFELWDAEAACSEWVVEIAEVAEYEPGSFYLRELPCLIAALQAAPAEVGPARTVVIDGYVWLDAHARPGLGAHLYEALGGGVPVVGVAKNPFAGSGFATPVLRGDSVRPLFITAVGIDVEDAATRVRSMHGGHRLPTLLRRVDRLARG